MDRTNFSLEYFDTKSYNQWEPNDFLFSVPHLLSWVQLEISISFLFFALWLLHLLFKDVVLMLKDVVFLLLLKSDAVFKADISF